MPLLQEGPVSALTKLPVEIAGTWEVRREVAWTGTATAPSTLAAVAFLQIAGRVVWCKSELAHGNAQPIHLLLGWHDAEGLDVQVNFSIGRGHAIWRCLLPSRDYRPAVASARTTHTGMLLHFARLDAKPFVDLFALFLDRADVRVARKRVWHARDNLLSTLSHPFGEILAGQRSGEIAA